MNRDGDDRALQLFREWAAVLLERRVARGEATPAEVDAIREVRAERVALELARQYADHH